MNEFEYLLDLMGFDTTMLVIGAMVLILFYFIHAYLRMKIGRKAGITSDWQAYVPFAQEVYLMKIVEEPFWKILFFGAYSTLVLFALGIITGILTVASLALLLSGSGNFPGEVVFCIIVFAIYYMIAFWVRVSVYRKLYVKFDKFNTFQVVAAVFGAFDVIILLAIADATIAMDDTVTENFNVEPPKPIRCEGGKKALITGTAGVYKGQNFEVLDGNEIFFGRDPSCCNVIFGNTETAVSRKHCSIKYIGMSDTFLVTVYSKNGVIYDANKKIEPGSSKMLHKGSVIAIGTETNQFILG